MREALDGFEGGVCFRGVCRRYHTHMQQWTRIDGLFCSVKQASEKKSLLLITKKTKIMVIDKRNSGEDFLLDGQVIEQVPEFRSCVTY